MKTVQIALYARVSSDRQAQEGTIESQIAAIQEFVSQAGGRIEPDMVFADNGVSGATLMRPALDTLRDKALNGEVERVYILSPDRLARKYAHQLLLVEEFKKLGVTIAFVNKSLSETPEDQMLLQIQGVISEYEREKILERTRRGKLHSAKKGKACVLSGAPFGYVYIKSTEEEDGHYVVHPEEASIIREMFDLYCNKQLSIGKIAATFTKNGYGTRTGKSMWERSVIWSMLKNPAYYGQAAFRKTKTVPRERATKQARDRSFYPRTTNSSSRSCPQADWIFIPVPALIEKQLFDRAQERLKENIKLSSRNNKKYNYLVSGLIRCKECGYAMYGKPASNSRYKRCYYRCMGQDGYRWASGRVCSGHPIRIEVIDDLVWKATEQLLTTPDVVMAEYGKRATKKKDKQVRSTLISQKKTVDLKSQLLEKERLLDLYQLGAIPLSEIESRLRTIRAKVKKIETEIATLNSESQKEQHQLQVITRFEEFAATLTKNLHSLTFNEKKQITRLLITDVVVDSTKEEIVLHHVLPSKKSSPLRLGSLVR